MFLLFRRGRPGQLEAELGEEESDGRGRSARPCARGDREAAAGVGSERGRGGTLGRGRRRPRGGEGGAARAGKEACGKQGLLELAARAWGLRAAVLCACV